MVSRKESVDVCGRKTRSGIFSESESESESYPSMIPRHTGCQIILKNLALGQHDKDMKDMKDMQEIDLIADRVQVTSQILDNIDHLVKQLQ